MAKVVSSEGQPRINMVANRDCSSTLDYSCSPQVAHFFIFRAVELISVKIVTNQPVREILA
jgi:hypothetical protein